MNLTATQPLTPTISPARAGERRTMLRRKQPLEDAGRSAPAASDEANAPCYIPHRADGGFVVFDNRRVGTASLKGQNGAPEC
jgi:hypothetical protein